MALGFERRKPYDDTLLNYQGLLEQRMTLEEQERYKKILRNWDFYEGYHWEEIAIDNADGPEVTMNYSRAFVDKFLSFELGKAFTFTTHADVENQEVTSDGRTLFKFLEDVWEDNEQYAFCMDLGQTKNVTGEAWVQVDFDSVDELSTDDIFDEYPEGRISITLHPTQHIFTEYDPLNQKKLLKVIVRFAYERDVFEENLLGQRLNPSTETVIYEQVWTKEQIITTDADSEPVYALNPYGFIPFVQIKNFSVSGKTYGRSDLDDIIPMNIEFNMKKSNTSEILDYHAAPVTIVYGARIGNLEKGANKMWGGLPKDGRVENLELRGDLEASNAYTSDLKLSMCEIAGIPETVLGGSKAISNTSGVALQYINLPLIEKTRIKRNNTETGLELVNKYIIYISLMQGLITKPENIPMRNFVHTEVTLPDTLPKDTLMELQQIQVELNSRLLSRRQALKRMGRENIDALLQEIDEEVQEMQNKFGTELPGNTSPQINSGMMNGQTPIEQLRVETTGRNADNT